MRAGMLLAILVLLPAAEASTLDRAASAGGASLGGVEATLAGQDASVGAEIAVPVAGTVQADADAALEAPRLALANPPLDTVLGVVQALPSLDVAVSALPGDRPSAAEQDPSSEGTRGKAAAAVVPEWPAEAAAPAAGGLAATLAIVWRLLAGAAASAGATPVGRLFSRIEGPRVLENPVRARIHDLVASRPGLSVAEIQSAAGVAWGTTVHHLRRLQAHGLVVSQSSEGRRRLFPANTEAARNRAAIAAVAHPTAQRIARLVGDRPGIGQGELCATLGLLRPAASKHLNRLAGEGLVAVRADGRQRMYAATPQLQAALAVA